MLIPVTDHGKPHLLSFWGGSAIPRSLEPNNNSGPERLGHHRYTRIRWRDSSSLAKTLAPMASSPTIPTAIRPSSMARMTRSPKIGAKTGRSEPLDRPSEYIRYMMIGLECIEALDGWIQAGKPNVSR